MNMLPFSTSTKLIIGHFDESILCTLSFLGEYIFTSKNMHLNHLGNGSDSCILFHCTIFHQPGKSFVFPSHNMKTVKDGAEVAPFAYSELF